MRAVSGFHAIEELLKAGKRGVILVSQKGPRVKDILELAKKAGVPVREAKKEELDRLSGDHRGVVFQAEGADEDGVKVSLDEWLASFDKERALVLVLDHIQDPHNFGAILRSADQFGAELVIVPSRRAVKDTETVARSSAGASAWVPVAEIANLARAVDMLKEKGFWVWACDMGGEPVWDADLSGRTAIVLGSEGPGVSRILKEAADGSVSIPSKGKVDSLNVSVAAGVFMYEWSREIPKGKKKA